MVAGVHRVTGREARNAFVDWSEQIAGTNQEVSQAAKMEIN